MPTHLHGPKTDPKKGVRKFDKIAQRNHGWIKVHRPEVLVGHEHWSNKVSTPMAKTLLSAHPGDFECLQLEVGTTDDVTSKRVLLTLGGREYRDRFAPVSGRRKGGLSDEERQQLIDLGLERAEIQRRSAQRQASDHLKWNRMADQEGSDLAWRAAGFDRKVGSIVMTDNGPVELKAVTQHMLPRVAGGSCDEENTRAGFQLTNQWMEAWHKKNKRPMTFDDLVSLVQTRLKTRKVKDFTLADAEAFWTVQDKQAAEQRERFRQAAQQ